MTSGQILQIWIVIVFVFGLAGIFDDTHFVIPQSTTLQAAPHAIAVKSILATPVLPKKIAQISKEVPDNPLPEAKPHEDTMQKNPLDTVVDAPVNPLALPPHVAVVGDSLTDQGRARIQELAGYVWDINGKGGRELADGVSVVHGFLVRGTYGAIVIALGTNNANYAANQNDVWIEQIVEAAASIPCKIWINIADSPADSGTGPASRIAAINAHLELLSARLGTDAWHIGDWHALVAAHPEYFLPSDYIHYTDEGYKARADLIEATLKHCGVQ